MKYRRALIPGGTFFFTVVTHNRMPLLARDDRVALLRDAFRYVMQRHPFQLEACVILPDHLHAIWTLPEDDHDYSTRWRLIKSYFSHRFQDKPQIPSSSRAAKQEKTVWQRRYWEHSIRDDADYAHHLNYIHYNPVKHGLASSPWEWPYSSFRQWVNKGVYTPDWGCEELSFETPVVEE
jgi:putative transposase